MSTGSITHWTFAAVAATVLLCAACDSQTGESGDDAMADDDAGQSRACEGETRDDFAIGVMRSGSSVEVSVSDAMPADPIRGDNGWTLSISDAAGGVVGVTIVVQPWMPDHGHGTPVPTEINDMGGGEYQLTPLNLFMAGLWEIHLDLELVDESVDDVMFTVCVE